MDDIKKFTIAHRRVNDPQLRPYEANTAEYTYIASAINLALAMLTKDSSKDMLVNIALIFDNTSLDSNMFQGNKASAEQWVKWFVNQLQHRFPPVIVDESITHLDCLGYHPRLPWDGKLQDFPFHTQGVHINGPRVKDMVAAGEGNSQASKQRFRDFQFAFATTLVHEAGPHILITWLGGGRPDTPPEMAVAGYATSDDQLGESGRFFELHVFGGTTEYYRDPSKDDGQVTFFRPQYNGLVLTVV
ncbi:hypothetical protein FQN54_003890 [Arachnomyces sp. PD_36]|nr:hypothetical protein FQN54_003890 [Arachnomyces sp. PD_36]